MGTRQVEYICPVTCHTTLAKSNTHTTKAHAHVMLQTLLQRCKVVDNGRQYTIFHDLAKILGVAHSWRQGNRSKNGDTATIVGEGVHPFNSKACVAIKLDHNGKVVLIARRGIVELSGKATKVCISRYRTHRVSATRSHSIDTVSSSPLSP